MKNSGSIARSHSERAVITPVGNVLLEGYGVTTACLKVTCDVGVRRVRDANPLLKHCRDQIQKINTRIRVHNTNDVLSLSLSLSLSQHDGARLR
jgi:hypothetical protein